MAKKLKINTELKEKLEKLYKEIYDTFGSDEFQKEKEKCDKYFIANDDLSEEEEDYCLLFNLENVSEFFGDMC